MPFTNIPIFGVRAHDTHHAIPNSNYGQYIMLWDYVMGTFRPHPHDSASPQIFQDEVAHTFGGARKPVKGE